MATRSLRTMLCQRRSNLIPKMPLSITAWRSKLMLSTTKPFLIRAVAYDYLKRHDFAVEDCSTAIDFDLTKSEAHNNRGISHRHLSDTRPIHTSGATVALSLMSIALPALTQIGACST